MAPTNKQIPSELSSVGVDIGKNVFHLVGFDRGGKIVFRRSRSCRVALSDWKPA